MKRSTVDSLRFTIAFAGPLVLLALFLLIIHFHTDLPAND